MHQNQLKTKIETDLYNELRWLLCAATEWDAQQQVIETDSAKQPCFHLKVYVMDSVFLHARNLYEFFTATRKRPDRLTWHDYGQPARQTSATYDRFINALHGRGMHLGNDRSSYEPVKHEVLNFANDILRLWAAFSGKPGIRPYKKALDDCHRRALNEANKVAEQYQQYGFKSPFA
jgi:hypothetical protein